MVDIQLLVDMIHLPHPMIIGRSANLRKFEEVDIPKKMRCWGADLDRLGYFTKPDQRMANAISDQISRARDAMAPYKPLRTSDSAHPPWKHNDTEHVRTQENLGARQPDVGFRQPQSFRRWVLVRLCYMMAVRICEGWSRFGCFCAHLDFPGVALHLTVVGNPGAALIYARLASARVEKLARGRGKERTFLSSPSLNQLKYAPTPSRRTRRRTYRWLSGKKIRRK